ncbi:MAG: transglutaminase family protein [Acidobacteriaceae bacterium]|nr:transglutaminase family protein [Acidobacteriaceae bacterium]
MLIRYGFEIDVQLWQPTALITTMDVHESERNAIVWEDSFETSPSVSVEQTIDAEGNRLRRLVSGPGVLGMKMTGVVKNSGALDDCDPGAELIPVENLPAEALPYLRGSRYCETDLLSDFAWGTFGSIAGGHARVQAVCDYVHNRLRFSYPEARPTRTAAQAMDEQVGVCRDFTHLAITLCRCLNIPARYCNGYLGDIGVPPDPAPMDFNAWFEAYIGGSWYTFDARHNARRIGRILIARGRDAADIPMITSFGPHKLTKFKVVTEEVQEHTALAA